MTDKQYIAQLEKQLGKQPPSDRQVFVNSMNKLAQKGNRKKPPRRKKSKEENEVINIGIAALVLFCIGYYYLQKWGYIL